MLPQASYTWMPWARSHTTGGCPPIDRGSNVLSFSRIGTACGGGIGVAMRRYLVLTLGTSCGCEVNQLMGVARLQHEIGRVPVFRGPIGYGRRRDCMPVVPLRIAG